MQLKATSHFCYTDFMDISTPLMTKFEFTRMQALEAQGVSHEEAKNKVYAERGPSGEPKNGPSPSTPTTAANLTYAPAPSVPPSMISTERSLPWWLILGLVGLVIYYFKRTSPTPPMSNEIPTSDDLGDLPTGIMPKPRRKRKR